MLTVDVWTVLLGIGLVVTFVSTVALIVGLAPARRAASARAQVAPAPPVPPAPSVGSVDLGSASTVRDRAAARARAAAAAATPPVTPVTPTARRYTLTDVHVVEPDAATDEPAGQAPSPADGHGEPLVSNEEARAIVNHFAEHDPSRIAEVISQWIRSDQQNGHDVAW